MASRDLARAVNIAGDSGHLSDALQKVWPVGSIFITTSSNTPEELLGFGAWTAFGAGRVLVGLDSGDTDFDTVEETGGSKTSAHTHDTGTLAASAHAGSAVADHASHTHTYTEVPNHTHPHNIQGNLAPSNTGTHVVASDLTGGSVRAMAIDTGNPTGGVATGTTNGPSATLSHNVTQPSDHTLSGNTGSTSSSTVQPYIVVNMWERTA